MIERAQPMERSSSKTKIWELLAGAALLWVYFPTLLHLADRWGKDPGASHGPLIPVISAVILWKMRLNLAEIPKNSSGWGIWVLCLGLFINALAVWADVLFLLPISLLIAIWGLVLYLFGWPIFKKAIFPLSFLLFAIPWPDFLVEAVSFPLQLWTSTYSAMIAGMLGVPVVRDGVELHVRDFTLAVAAPCSGIRSLVALMSITALFAYLLPASMPRRIGLFLTGIPVALIANTIRVVAIMLVAIQFGRKVALGFFHDYSSPFLFVMACLVLTGLWKALSVNPDKSTIAGGENSDGVNL